MLARLRPLARTAVPLARLPAPVLPTSTMLSATRRVLSTSPYVTEQALRAQRNRMIIGGLAGAGILGLGLYGMTAESAPSPIPVVGDSVQERVHSTYRHLGGGIVVTALSAVAAFRTPLLRTVGLSSPWLLLGGTIVSMLVATSVPKENTVAKAAAFGLFNGMIGLSLAPLGIMGGPLVIQAAAYTGAIVGSLSYVAATSPSDRFLSMAGPLAIGLGVVCVASLGSVFLPATSALSSVAGAVSLYGGLGVFSLYVLHHTGEVKRHAELLPPGQFDPYNESLGLYLDTINIFVRVAQVMAGSQRRR